MLSLIICSRTPSISEELEKNIAETIGCEYELVVIDNSKNKYSIFSAYNEGVRRAKGDVLCFMHDDILYKTNNWGTKVKKTFEDESVGGVGILGSYCLLANGYWEQMMPYTVGKTYMSSDESKIYDMNFFDELPTEVSVFDGFWFCIPHYLFETISFDEKTFDGFHWYDMDICMQILDLGKKLIVNRELDIRHICKSHYSKPFFDNMDTFNKKWKDKLPVWRSIKPEVAVSLSIDKRNKMQRLLQTQTDSYQERYFSVLNSFAFKLGDTILTPIYLLKKILCK